MLRKIDVGECVDWRYMKWERMRMSVTEWEKMIGSYASAIGCALSASNRMHFDIIKLEVENVKMALSYDDRDGYDDINRIVFQQWHRHTGAMHTVVCLNCLRKETEPNVIRFVRLFRWLVRAIEHTGWAKVVYFSFGGGGWWLIKLIIFQFPYADMLGLNHFVCLKKKTRKKLPCDLSNRSLYASENVYMCVCVVFSHVGISCRDAAIALLLFLMQNIF